MISLRQGLAYTAAVTSLIVIAWIMIYAPKPKGCWIIGGAMVMGCR